MNTKTTPAAITAATTLLFSSTLQAALLIEESFDYAATGNVNSLSGGTGFTGSWVSTRGTPDIATPDKPWGDLSTAGNHIKGGAWSGATRLIGTTLSNAGLMDDGGVLWFSVIFDLEGQNFANADLNFALASDKFESSTFGDRENLNTGEGIGITHFRGNIRGASWRNTDADPVAERATYNSSFTLTPGNSRVLIAGKIEWGATSTDDEILTLYAPGTDLTLGTPILTTPIAALDQSAFDTLALQFKDTSQMDEIRFGGTAADVLPSNVVVIPEPSTVGLLSLAAIGLLVRRRN